VGGGGGGRCRRAAGGGRRRCVPRPPPQPLPPPLPSRSSRPRGALPPSLPRALVREPSGRPRDLTSCSALGGDAALAGDGSRRSERGEAAGRTGGRIRVQLRASGTVRGRADARRQAAARALVCCASMGGQSSVAVGRGAEEREGLCVTPSQLQQCLPALLLHRSPLPPPPLLPALLQHSLMRDGVAPKREGGSGDREVTMGDRRLQWAEGGKETEAGGGREASSGGRARSGHAKRAHLFQALGRLAVPS
jgi:hypothetical protein